MENKKVIEIKFNSRKEKIFIFLKENTTLKAFDELFKLFNLQHENKIYLLPENFVSSVKVIKDIKDRKVEKFIRFLKKDIAKLSGMKIKRLFGAKK